MVSHHLPLFFIVIIPMFCFSPVEVLALPSPFWLRKGAYVHYFTNFTVLSFLNGTDIWNGNGTYGWECTSIVGDVATLDVLLAITGKRVNPNETKPTAYASVTHYTVHIETETRRAFCDGEDLGFLPHWIPADIEKLPYADADTLPDWVPKDIEWKMIEDFISLDNATTYGLVAGVQPSIFTPYKTFRGDELRSVFGAFNLTQGFSYTYEKDSGILVEMGMGTDNFWRKIVKVNYIKKLLLNDTNIHALPEPPSPFAAMQPYIVTATIIAATAATIYAVNTKRKPKPQTQHQKPEATTQH